MKTLVIVLSETRAAELTFNSFKANVIDRLSVPNSVGEVDLCVCIGVRPDYDYDNPYYKLAKYRFTYDEPDDFADAFDYAYNIELSKTVGETPLHWREFLKIKDQFLGGIKDAHHQHPGSAGILIFFRWFLLHKLLEHDLISKYDRFVITRSDYIYQLPHPDVARMDNGIIWIPDSEHYGGYTDRHVVLSPTTIVPYLNIFTNMVHRSHDYYMKMRTRTSWNLESLIRFHLQQNGVDGQVRQFPYVMYSVRNLNGQTRWSPGTFSKEHGYYIKYPSEHSKSTAYKNEFAKSGMSIDDFYMRKNLYQQ